MPRPMKSRSHPKARWRSDSRAAGKPGHDSPEPEKTSKAKFIAREQYRAKARAKALNRRREPSIDIHRLALEKMKEYGFEAVFLFVEIGKANGLDEGTVKRAGASVRDLRHLLWSSIDNYDAVDLDQLEYCERGQGGEILVKVAIADVDAFVPKGSVLDERAQANATSVYTGSGVFPMLPERLSRDLCALHMGHDRLAIVVEFAVQLHGDIRPVKIYRAIVRNKAQLSYDEIGGWLNAKARTGGAVGSSSQPSGDGPDDGGEQRPDILDEIPGLEEQLLLQEEASLRLGRCMSGQFVLEVEKRGAKAAAMAGKSLWLYVEDENRAKRIVENFMIGASGVMAGFLEEMNIPVIRRAVGSPKDWGGIAAIANAKGFGLPPEPDAAALSEFLMKEKNACPEKFPGLSRDIAAMLGPGEYAVFDKITTPECFCLAVANYAPGVAPNQKYMDLIIQRLVKSAVAHTATPYGKDELLELAVFCSEREQAAKKVERSVKYAAANRA